MPQPDIAIRSLRESDLPEADRILRLAFGTFLGLPDPMVLWKGVDYVRTRWLADPSAAFVAELDSEVVGSNFVTSWGSFGFFGPLTVRPDLWDKGVAKKLLQPTMKLFETRGTNHVGLFTFANSPKHIGLYQKFGFWPRYLTAIMTKQVANRPASSHWSKYSDLSKEDQDRRLHECRDLTAEVYSGLNLSREIKAVSTQNIGDTVLLRTDDDKELAGFAVCHCGPGSEAGPNSCYVKFGAVRPGPNAGGDFVQLLNSCEALAATRGMSTLIAGVNTGRQEAYGRMIAHGFRTDFQGVAMEKPSGQGYNRTDVHVIDDWR